MYVPFRRLAMPQPRLTVKHRSARLVVGIREPLWEGRPGTRPMEHFFADAYLR